MEKEISFRWVILSILVLVIFTIRIYLIIEKSNDDHVSTAARSLVIDYMCPQFPSSSSSKGYFHVDFTDNLQVDSTKICKSDDVLLIYILSKIDHIDRRERIRRTWANKNEYEQLFRTCFVFFIGQTKNSSLHTQILSESSIYGDLVQLNVHESYRNIVYKEVGGLKWSHMYASHIPYLFKTDDDVIIDSLLLSDTARYFLENRTDHSDYFQKQVKMQEFTQQMVLVNKYTLFKGIYTDGRRTIRRGKFGLHHVAWNHDNLPGYCRGFGYMFSSFIRDRLYRASLCYALEYVPWVGDLFVSGSLASAAAVRCSAWTMEYSQIPDGCAAQFAKQPRLLLCTTPMHMGRLSMIDYDQTWRVILHRHSMTNETIEKAKKKRTALFKEQLEEKLLVEESIIEQMQGDLIVQGGAIVPWNQRDENLDS